MTSEAAPRVAPDLVAIVMALDRKADEAAFVRDAVRGHGLTPCLVDVGVLRDPAIAPDVTAAEVAERGGASLAGLRADGDRNRAVEAMRLGAERVVTGLHRDGRLAAVLAAGGSGGTSIGTGAMRALPHGVPKVMVSTLAAGDVRDYVGHADICMINAVVDFCGVNDISARVLANAAAAACGMARVAAGPLARTPRPMIAASMFGVTDACVSAAGALVAEAGFQLVPFHATGIGGRAMESLIASGSFVGVLDLTTTEWADEVVGGSLSAGPTRLSAAGAAGVPQVVAPGALDMVNFVGPDGVPERYRDRVTHRHNPDVVLMRTSAAECREIGTRMAERLNAATGPTTVLFPTRGLSALDVEGGPFFDPDADAALLDTLQRRCRPPVEVTALDLHINDPDFARACCETLLASLPAGDPRSEHA